MATLELNRFISLEHTSGGRVRDRRPQRHSLPASSGQKRRKHSIRPKSLANPSVVLELPPLPPTDDAQVLKVGLLYKTTFRRREGSRPGTTKLRRFQLTEEALEYMDNFNQVKVRRSFPLISVRKVEYDESSDPKRFILAFSNCLEILRAHSATEAKDWVEKIEEASAKWHLTSMDTSIKELLQGLGTPTGTEVDVGPQTKPFQRRRLFSSPYVVLESALEDQEEETTSRTEGVKFVMIKYPRRTLRLPQEQQFKIDANNKQIMWRKNARNKFKQVNSLSLHRVVEVREGQNTAQFDKFPFEKAEKQSFSLIYPQEDKKYTRYASLDLICIQPQFYRLWIDEMRSMASVECERSSHLLLSSQKNESLDSTVLWLKQVWVCESIEGELRESDATQMAKKLNPLATDAYARRIVALCHHYQLESSRWLALDLSGFILMFNLISDFSGSRLHSLFKEYAKTSPDLGMTLQEFREFLVSECYWPKESCTTEHLLRLVQSHDSYHCAYKKYLAKNKAAHYVVGRKLFSFAGFLSFLRSQDNSAIDPEHETVHQDMTQPLSHYFINSSHNTYLEGDQLSGNSSTEAYIRAFFQGCRCVEIDCWDDTLNINNLDEREPIIYHGFTLTSKLRFREVMHAIKDYAFTSSNYPVIISIENHCNKSLQTTMAKVFRAVFDEVLPKENLVEQDGRTRLPSPEELKGKIILKGSNKEKDKKVPAQHQLLRKVQSGSGATPTSTPPPTPVDKRPHRPAQEFKGSQDNEVTAQTSKPPPTSLEDEVTSATSKEHESEEELEEKHKKFSLRSRFSHRSLKSIRSLVLEAETGQDDQEVMYRETVGDLKSLFVYAKATSIKPWNWERQRATNVTQMFSFGEPKAVDLCTKDVKDMLACTERQLVRTYPKGTRFDSSNYDPMLMWRCGVQMVSLNFQYPDIFMHLNQGFFRRNGGCGYILKPAVMRRENPGEGSTPFNPDMKEPHPDVPPLDLEIELLSGQRLCFWKKRCSSVTVAINTFGVGHDCASMKEATHNNCLWPDWAKGQHILKHTIFMPELCLLYLRVEADKKLFGQNCISVISLHSGIKFIPLRTPGGELIPGSGLFVKIKKREATEPAATEAEPTSTVVTILDKPTEQKEKAMITVDVEGGGGEIEREQQSAGRPASLATAQNDNDMYTYID